MLPDARDVVSRARLRRLESRDHDAIARLCLSDPLVHCFPASRIDAGLDRHGSSQFFGWFDGDDVLQSAVYVGANVAPVATSRISRLAFAERLIGMSRRVASLVGRADEVLDLWGLLEPSWGAAREVRPRQHLLVCRQVAPGLASTQVRPTALSQFDLLMPACVAMFTEELGISPVAQGMHASYQARVRELIAAGRSFSLILDGRVVFKAEVGAAANHVAQIQGVWVAPTQRGRGYGVSGVAAVTEQLLAAGFSAVTLYANEFNDQALRVYDRVGFRRHDTFATVLR